MFDRIDAGSDSAFRCFCSVCVGCGLPAQRVSLVHNRVQLRLCQLRNVNIVGGREDTSARASFDNVGSVLDVESNGITSIVSRIYDAVLRTGLVIQRSEAKSVSSVAMAACRAQGMDGNKHSRSHHDARINRLAQTDVKEVAAPNVSNGREPGQQCLARVLCGSNRLLSNCPLQPSQLSTLVVGIEIECQ